MVPHILIIRDLDHGTMLQIMARENMDEWENNVLIEQETVRATVQAFADDLIQLGPVRERTRENYKRHAPSFLSSLGHDQGAVHVMSAKAGTPPCKLARPGLISLLARLAKSWSEARPRKR